MFVRRSPALAFASLLFVLSAPRSFAAWPTSALTPVPVCVAPGSQDALAAVPDGSGGAFVAWLDPRGGGVSDIYLNRIADGAVFPGWPANGIAVESTPVAVSAPVLVPGTQGDVWVVWSDARTGNDDVWATRVLGDGTIAPGFPTSGVALTALNRAELAPSACPDGAGGVYVTWLLEYTPGSDYDVYATHLNADGTFATGFGVGGVPINAGLGIQGFPIVAEDGAGSAVVAYIERNGEPNPAVWAQKLGPNGERPWGSPTAGVRVSYLTNAQANPRVVPDGRGGALIAYEVTVGTDVTLSVSGLDAAGTLRSSGSTSTPGHWILRSFVADGVGGAWIEAAKFGTPVTHQLYHFDPSGQILARAGVTIVSSNPDQFVGLATDTDGTAFAVWSSQATNAMVGQHYGTDLSALWSAPVTCGTGPGWMQDAVAVSDGRGGVIAVWRDNRNGNLDLYAARLDAFGALGDAAPRITGVADVPNDQGGFVNVTWAASYKDVRPTFPIVRYSIWRRVPTGLAAKRAAAGVRVLAAGEPRPDGVGSVLRVQHAMTTDVYWEYVSTTPARGYAGYAAVVATTGDSLPGANPRTWFQVEAETANGIPFWDSAPDSGYSVDNLPPLAPAPFTGTYSAGASTLAWGANVEADLRGYRLYRGSSPSFVPSPANRVVEPASTAYVDPAGAPYWYKVSAVDVHGNESSVATVLPSFTTGADDAMLPRELSLAAPQPNPAPGATTLRFALPRAGAVSLAVFDPNGRRVRTLAEGERPAGEQSVRWDGRGESGDRVGAGLYFVRLQSDGRVLQRRVALLP